jgi:hypothetical protein
LLVKDHSTVEDALKVLIPTLTFIYQYGSFPAIRSLLLETTTNDELNALMDFLQHSLANQDDLSMAVRFKHSIEELSKLTNAD